MNEMKPDQNDKLNTDGKKNKAKPVKVLMHLWPAAIVAALVLGSLPDTAQILPEVPELLSLEVYAASVDEDSESKEETHNREKDKNEESEKKVQAVGNYEDGVYTGSAQGYGGTVTVQVTVEKGQIVSVEILEAGGETEPFFTMANGVIENVLLSQTWEVDVITGATFSSRGILGAIQNALTGESVVNEAPETAEPQGTITSVAFEEPTGGYKDGTYTGSANGFGGLITVQVTIKDGKITGISIISAAGETAQYLANASSVTGRIIAAQSPNVDTVSGATYSSTGIINAVKSALSKAGGTAETVKVQKEETTKTVPTTKPNNNTKSTSDPLSDDSVTLKDGTYTGDGTGFGGTITVKTVIKNGKIASISVISAEDETPEFLEKAKGLIKNIISGQTTNVDTVSGATYSSNGIIEAVKAAVSKAVISKNTDNTDDDQTEKTDSDQKDQEDDSNQDPEEPTVTTGTSRYVDGVYEGSAEGFGGKLTVQVTVSGDVITDITVKENSETPSYLKRAKGVISSILSGQTADVDTISGATYSSRGIIGAVKDALLKANNSGQSSEDNKDDDKDDKDPAETGSDEGKTDTGSDEGETDTDSGNEGTDDKQDGEGESTGEGDGTGEGENTGQDSEDEQGEDPASPYKDGVYTGQYHLEMFNYDIFITVTIQNGIITSITADRYEDEDSWDWEDNDYYFWNAANGPNDDGTGMISRLLAQKNSNVNVVSGATYSSRGIISAFESALEQAKS